MTTRIDTRSVAASRMAGSSPLQTTLYDLIEAVSDEVRPNEEALVPAIVVRLLRSHKIKFIGKYVGRRVCYEPRYVSSASA
jgi:hypothetical protein